MHIGSQQLMKTETVGPETNSNSERWTHTCDPFLSIVELRISPDKSDEVEEARQHGRNLFGSGLGQLFTRLFQYVEEL